MLKIILFFGIGFSILYFVYGKYNTAWLAQCDLDGKSLEACGTLAQKVAKDFLSVKYFWIFLVLFAFTISNISRALRWNMLIRPLGYSPKLSNSFFTIIIGYFVNLFLPRVGEIVRAATMSKYEKIPVEKLVGTIVIGRTVDVLCFALAIGLTFLLEFDTLSNYITANRTPGGGGAAGGHFFSSPLFLILGSLGLICSLLLYFFWSQISKTILFIKVVNILKGLWEGIQTVRKMENPWVFIFHSLNIWVMYYLMTYICFFAFEPTTGLSPLAGLMAFVFGALGIVIPSPGGMGTYHFFTSEALMIYGLDQANAFSLRIFFLLRFR